MISFVPMIACVIAIFVLAIILNIWTMKHVRFNFMVIAVIVALVFGSGPDFSTYKMIANGSMNINQSLWLGKSLLLVTAILFLLFLLIGFRKLKLTFPPKRQL